MAARFGSRRTSLRQGRTGRPKESTLVRVVGVDVSEKRGQTVALLDDDLTAWVQTVSGAADVVALVQEQGAAVVAVDSPLQPSRMLLREPAHRAAFGVPDRKGMRGLVYQNYRVCDFELIRRGMPLYQVAESEEKAARWMRVGFDLARRLIPAGYRLPRDAADHAATLIEVFPDASFVTVLGARPLRKSGRTGNDGRRQRREALAREGIALDPALSHDGLDAVAAALTALRWQQGRGCALGHPEEGMIVAPVPRSELRDRYYPMMRAADNSA